MSSAHNNYYSVKNGLQTGPIKLHELKNISLGQGIQVWTPGLEDWIQIYSAEDITAKLASTEDVQASSSRAEKVEALPSDKASIMRRAVGFFINCVPFFISFKIFDSQMYSWAILYLFIPVASAFTYKLKAGNFGHVVLKMKVVSASTGEEMNDPIRGFLRELAKSFLLFFILPQLWLLFDKKNQNLYDKFFDTVVVKANQETE